MIDYEVREGQRVAPTCSECGCRLAEFESMWYHYLGKAVVTQLPTMAVYWTRDAKGHICSRLNSGIELPQ